jgi:ribose/xylose/arabinose/galactoside ABC-type transport system permease subunit
MVNVGKVIIRTYLLQGLCCVLSITCFECNIRGGTRVYPESRSLPFVALPVLPSMHTETYDALE